MRGRKGTKFEIQQGQRIKNIYLSKNDLGRKGDLASKKLWKGGSFSRRKIYLWVNDGCLGHWNPCSVRIFYDWLFLDGRSVPYTIQFWCGGEVIPGQCGPELCKNELVSN